LSEEITGHGRDIFGEGEGGGADVFIKKVDVVSFRIGWIIVKREIAGQHRVLPVRHACAWGLGYQDDTATPDVDFSACVQPICHYEFRSCIAGASATRLHQIPRSPIIGWCNDIVIILAQFLDIKRIGKSKVCDDNVSILVQQEIFLDIRKGYGWRRHTNLRSLWTMPFSCKYETPLMS
jgi:hypothetical protein